jgi:hemolysin III
MRTTAPTGVPRPRWRGKVHTVAAVVAVPLGVVLTVATPPGPARVAAVVYSVCAAAVYVTSALYHRLEHSEASRLRWRRADHSMIFLGIAGTYTPLCVMAVGGTFRWALLAGVWAGALAGVALKVVGLERFPRLGSAAYLVLGWAGVLVVPFLVSRPLVISGVVLGGILYTVGAVLFGLKRPVLRPAVFGFHEVWHVLGVAAGLSMWIAIFALAVTS